MESDLSLIEKIKSSNDEKCLMELIQRHSGIYIHIVGQYSRNENPMMDVNSIMEDKDYIIYKSALNYNPNDNTKFSTYLANETKWKCLNSINKKRRLKEDSLEEYQYDASTEITAIDDIEKTEAFDLFQTMLKKEKDHRVKKIIDIRYNSDNNKLIPWKIVAKKMNMSIQGCINIHNRFIKKTKETLNKNYV